MLKPGVKIKFHGDFVEAEGTRIKGLISNSEMWEKEVI